MGCRVYLHVAAGVARWRGVHVCCYEKGNVRRCPRDNRKRWPRRAVDQGLSVWLIVMQILGNTKTFFDSQAYIQDTNVTEYLNKTIEDEYGILFDMAQNETMNDMVNSQWQKSR